MGADGQKPFDPLNMDILGPDSGEPGAAPEFPGMQPPNADWGRGDLAPEQPSTAGESARRASDRAEWQSILRAIVADLSPSVGLRFRAWAALHADLIKTMPTQQAFGLYLEVATYRDAVADEYRSEDQKEYDWAELHMAGLRPLIDAEIQAQREEIADGVRQAMLARLQALRDTGVISEEALQVMMAGVSDG